MKLRKATLLSKLWTRHDDDGRGHGKGSAFRWAAALERLGHELPLREPTDGNDVLIGRRHADQIDGLAGDDLILGLGGDDQLRGGSGRDHIAGGSGRDLLEGGPDADRLRGGTGDDRLRGGAGDDHLDGQAGDDLLEGDSDVRWSGRRPDDRRQRRRPFRLSECPRGW